MADMRRGDGDGPAPGDHAPAGLLYVPVRPVRCCYVTCFFRTPGGRRTAVAFTTSAQLRATLGQDQPWIRLSAAALRSLAAPLGCTALTVDPRSSVPPGGTPPRDASGHR
ncbi:SAV_915 family protein [Streptomyces sp. NPDC051041]|uniref:SAV_915 family protein n=1 Tax=Streptomyces sp. NPDC051041 TaxID=3365640 RepID=UPI00379B0E14